MLMRADYHIRRSEGRSARARVLLSAADRDVLATLYQFGVVHGNAADDSFDRLSDFCEHVFSTGSVPFPRTP